MTTPTADINAKLEYVYETYVLSKINTIYYGRRLALTQRYNTILEIVIALGATGSGAAGLKALFQTDSQLQWAWLVIAGASALFAIVKPIVQLNKKVETYTKLFTGHNANYFALKDIVVSITANHEFSPELERQFSSIKNRFRELATLDDPSPYQKEIDSIAESVKRRIPDSSFWWQKAAETKTAHVAASEDIAAAGSLSSNEGYLVVEDAAGSQLKFKAVPLGVEPSAPPVRRPPPREPIERA